MAKELTKNQKKAKIKKLVLEMLKARKSIINEKIDRALNSGCIDVDKWDEKTAPMITPKCIIVAIMETEAYSFSPIGCSKTIIKESRKETNNIKLFI